MNFQSIFNFRINIQNKLNSTFSSESKTTHRASLAIKFAISERMRSSLVDGRKKAFDSLKQLSLIKHKPFIESFESEIKRIDHLSLRLISSEKITEEIKSNIQECDAKLEVLKDHLCSAEGEPTISPSERKEVLQGIRQAKSILAQIEAFADAMSTYEVKAQATLEAEKLFCESKRIDPLSSGDSLKVLLSSISLLEKDLILPDPATGNLHANNVIELHEMLIDRIALQISELNTSIKEMLQQDCKHLRYLAHHKDSKEQIAAERQLGALKTHLDLMLVKDSIKGSIPKALELHVNLMREILTEAKREINKILRVNASSCDKVSLKYGSSEWHSLVTKRKPMPKGLLSRSVTYLNPLGHIPAKWHPTTERVAKVCFGIILAAGIALTCNSMMQYHGTPSNNEHSVLFNRDTTPNPKIANTVNPLISGIGTFNHVISLTDQSSLNRSIWEGLTVGTSITDQLYQITPHILNDSSQVVVGIQNDLNSTVLRLNNILDTTPTADSTVFEVATWQQSIAENGYVANALIGRYRDLREWEKQTPEALVETGRRGQNRRLIKEVLNKPASEPTDKVYAHLVGLYTGDFLNATIGEQSLEGMQTPDPYRILVDTQKAYLEVLKSDPEFSISGYSSSCHESNCATIFGDAELKIASNEAIAIEKAIEKMEFSQLTIYVKDLAKSKLIEEGFNKLIPGETLFFPIGWGGTSPHGMMMEVEKDLEGKMVARIFNLGSGAIYHSQTSDKYIPFQEIVEIDPKRFFGGAFLAFLDAVDKSKPLFASKWNPSIVYEVGLASLGGKSSGRHESSELLRDSQYVGNCVMSSLVAVLDKTYVAAPLAERMRAFTLYRSTAAYFAAHQNNLVSGKDEESRRRLLSIGAQATLEAVQRAIEIGGFVGEEAVDLLEGIQQIKQKLSKLETEAYQLMADKSFSFEGIKAWIASPPDLSSVSTSGLKTKGFEGVVSKSPQKVKSDKKPLKRSSTPLFSPHPFKDKTLESILNHVKNSSETPLSGNGASILTQIDLDQLANYDIDEARSLMAAYQTESLKITENIALMGQRPVNFLDSDRLMMIHELMLDSDSLMKNLESEPDLINEIATFCNRGRSLANLVQSVFSESYFGYLAGTVHENLKKILAQKKMVYDLSNFPNSKEFFRQLIDDTDHEQEKNRLKTIHFYRIKSYEMHKKLTAEDTIELFPSLNYLLTQGYPTDVPVDAKGEVAKIRDLIEYGHHYLNDPVACNSIINGIAKGIDPDHIDCLWQQDESSELFYNPEMTMMYNKVTGLLESSTLGKIDPPAILTDDAIFRSIVSDPDSPLDRLDQNTYIYKSPSGTGYRFAIKDDKVTTFREFNQKWFQAVDRTSVLNLPIAIGNTSALHEGGILWVSQEVRQLVYTGPGNHPIIAFETLQTLSSSESLLGRFTINVKEVLTPTDWVGELLTPSLGRTNMTFVDSSSNSLSEIIQRIENPKYTFSFANKGTLARVEMPRLGLKFQSSGSKGQGNNIIDCRELDGYGLYSGKQGAPLFDDFNQYLSVKKVDDSGVEEQGVVIPYLPFANQESGVLSTPTAFTKPTDEWTEKVPYFFYRLKDGVLVPQVNHMGDAIQANVHVATIYLSERRYEDAVNYLNTADRLLKIISTRVDGKVIAPLIQLASFFNLNQDPSADAAAIRLRAASMIQRLLLLDQTDAAEFPFKDDYSIYSKHINRVKESLRLSQEESQLIVQKTSSAEGILLSMPQPLDLAMPIVSPNYPVNVRSILTTGSQEQVDVNSVYLKLFPAPFESISKIILSMNSVFVDTFPEEIMPLYRILRNPEDVGVADRRKIAHQFGLDTNINVSELKLTLTTFIELRFRFLIDQVQMAGGQLAQLTDEGEKFKLNSLIAKMQSEVNLIGALVNIGRGKLSEEREIEADVRKYEELFHSLKTLPRYQSEIDKYAELNSHLQKDTLAEAGELWKLWVSPMALPVPLSIDRATELTKTFVGPLLTEPVLDVSGKHDEDVSTSFPAILARKSVATFYSGVPLVTPAFFRSCFETKTVPAIPSVSPFVLGEGVKDKFIQEIFSQQNVQYQQYLALGQADQSEYSIKNKGLLSDQVVQFKSEINIIGSNLQSLEQNLLNQLNSRSRVPSVRIHEKIKLARGVVRELTVGDAKTAIANGWDRKYLHDLNPNLSLAEIDDIFKMTLELLVERREIQRRNRVVGAIEEVLSGDSTKPSWQFLIEKMKQVVGEKIHYDPYDYPAFLVAETEFNVALWSQQVPAIQRLAPREQIASLVELAMGLGKTDVISPVVLSLLADGTTLPILVMPEALLPSVAPQLQKRMGEGFDMEVRTIPVNRGKWTLERVVDLKSELVRMRDQRTSLVWSSSDIQTLINSYFEDMDGIINSSAVAEDFKRIKAWKELFTFLKSSSQIIGDEIHAILDILTSYNFSLGDPKDLEKDEMDALADFIKVIISHPSVVGKVRLPFLKDSKGVPLTQEHFRKEVGKEVVDTLLVRGVTGDARSRELFESFSEEKRGVIRSYLSSTTNEAFQKIQRDFFLPSIDSTLIEKLEKGTLALDSPQVRKVLSTLLQSDKIAMGQYFGVKEFVDGLKELSTIYKDLNQRTYNFLAVQKESLRLVFTITANAQIGKHYTMNLENSGAIPADNGTPLWDAQFGSSLERLYYTAFLVSQTKVTEEVIRRDLDVFVEKYRKLILDNAQDVSVGSEINIHANPLIISFRERYGDRSHLKERGFNDAEVTQLTEWVNENMERQLPLIRNYYFPELKVYPKEIETTTHMFPLIAKPGFGLRGTTGTLYNKATFPKVFTQEFLSDTTPKVMERIRLSKQKEAISVATSGDPAQVLGKMYSLSSAGPGSVIDTTGYIKKDNLEAYARYMLEAMNEKNPLITAVVYYEGDTLKVLKKGVDSSTLYENNLPRESLAALWDVSHTTGSNIIIDPTAHAYLIVGKHIRLFELGQSAMRLRGLGVGQEVVVAISEDDRAVLIEKLSKYLGVSIAVDQPLTVDHVIQYALLNEGIEETENNWRAVDMRMRMAVMEPILQQVLWNQDISAEISTAAFIKIKQLFIKERSSQPWDQYGMPVHKVSIEEGGKARYQSWLSHSVLKEINENPELFPNVDVKEIIRKLESIRSEYPGPLQSEVDSENYLGQKQKVQAKVQLKTQQKTRKKEKNRERTQLRLQQKKIVKFTDRNLPPLRRKPYQQIPVIPMAQDPFKRTAYNLVPIKESAKLSASLLQSQKMPETGISLSDMLSLDPALMKALNLNNPDISMSLNLVPEWFVESGTNPLYTPYNFFHKYASHALIIHDKASDTIKVKLVDFNDAEQIVEKMKQDREHPENVDTNEVNLSLYHLDADRVIASGTVPANPRRSINHEMKITDLLTQAKVVSGIIHYTPDQLSSLEKWLKARHPKEILDTFIFKIASNRDGFLEGFIKSPLAKVFMKCGISKASIEEVLASPKVSNKAAVRSLLFDRGLTPQQWLETLQRIKNSLEQEDFNIKSYTGEWSDIAAPLLPIIFDMPETSGAPYRRVWGFFDSETGLIPNMRAVQRRVLMNIFFPNIADEYGAWRTAVPQMVGKVGDSGQQTDILSRFKRLVSLTGDASFGVDADTTYLVESLGALKGKINPVTANADQLELMSELAHPLWGLPLLSCSSGTGDFYGISSRVKKKLSEADHSELYMPEIAAEVPDSTHSRLAHQLAATAISHVDLVASLRAIKAGYPDYEFERLYGIFAHLVKEGDSAHLEARRMFALTMLPRLYGHKLGEDMKYYIDFIPKSLTISSEMYTSKEINTLLDECYNAFLNVDPDIKDAHSSDRNPVDYEQTFALRAFAKDAPTEIAKITASWVNQQLKSHPDGTRWMTLLLLQLFKRSEALVDHMQVNTYFHKDSYSFMFCANIMGVSPSIRSHDFSILTYDWRLKDFDLFADIAELKSIGKPVLTAYDMAKKWTDALNSQVPAGPVPQDKQLVDNKRVKPSVDLWDKILGPIEKSVVESPPTEEADKKILRDLITVLDKYSGQMNEESFEILQRRLGKIRLAAYHSFDLAKRRDDALVEIKKIPLQDRLTEKINIFFVSNFLLTDAEWKTVPPEAVQTLLGDLNIISKSNPSYEASGWKAFFLGIIKPLIVDGTDAQKDLMFKWVNDALKSSDQSKMVDASVFFFLEQSAEKIQHTDLVKYVKGREEYFIYLMTYENNFFSGMFAESDFELYAELVGLKTAGRIPLRHSEFATRASKAVESISLNFKNFYAITSTVLSSIKNKAVEEGTVDVNAISTLLKGIEAKTDDLTNLMLSAYEQESYNKLVSDTIPLRLISDFSNADAGKNLQEAVLEYFTKPQVRLRHSAYVQLIPILQERVKDTTWMSDTFKGVVDGFKENPLSSADEVIIENLFASGNKALLPSLVNEMLGSVKASSPILDKFLKLLFPDEIGDIEHAKIKSYLALKEDKYFWESKDDFISKELMSKLKGKDSITALALGNNALVNNFDLIIDLLNIKTKNPPILPLSEFTTALENKGEEDLIAEVLINRIAKFDFNDSANRELMSNSLVHIEQMVSIKLHTQLNALRMKIDFKGSPSDNISKAFDKLLMGSSSYTRIRIYKELIKDVWIPQAKGELGTLIPQLLSQIIQAKKSANRNIVDLLMDMVGYDIEKIGPDLANWLRTNAANADLFLTTELFRRLIYYASLSFDALNNCWTALSAEQKNSFLEHESKFRFGLPTNIFTPDHFVLLLSLAKYDLKNVPELSLLQVLTHFDPNLIPQVGSFAANFCDLVIAKLPKKGFFGGFKALDPAEAEKLKRFINTLEVKDSSQIGSYIGESLEAMKKYL